MAGNIYGYQGVHTPLESVTQGRYTLSDYTSMRTELTSRLIALENQGGFVPTNVEITGYLHMIPGGAGMGEIETTSSITGESLYINSEAHCGSIVCDSNITFAGSIYGDGSALTGIVATVPAPTLVYYATSPGLVAINFTAADNYIRLASSFGTSFAFTARIIGQKITFIRDAINPAIGNQFYWTAGTLPYRVLALDGTITNLSSSGPVAAITYTYAGIQKIRNVYLVAAPLTPSTYSFDLIEIS